MIENMKMTEADGDGEQIRRDRRDGGRGEKSKEAEREGGKMEKGRILEW